MLAEIESLSERLAQLGWVLRTGASPGADQAFYRGARRGGGHAELYLPWPGFERHSWSDARAREVSVLTRPRDYAAILREGRHRMPGFKLVLRPAQEDDILAWLRRRRVK